MDDSRITGALGKDYFKKMRTKISSLMSQKYNRNQPEVNLFIENENNLKNPYINIKKRNSFCRPTIRDNTLAIYL